MNESQAEILKLIIDKLPAKLLAMVLMHQLDQDSNDMLKQLQSLIQQVSSARE